MLKRIGLQLGFRTDPNIVPGSYQLEVYHTAADKQISKDNRVYSGTVSLENGKEVVLTMSR